MIRRLLMILLMGLAFPVIQAQQIPVKAPEPVYPVPSASQLAWHEMEMNAFIHFTTNTFTDKEWGYGDESESVFNPSQLDTRQWARVLKDAGFKSMILTCKHHDGFCLWPSKYTEHSIKRSPYKNGNGDIVLEVSNAAKKFGLNFGVYLSPWDRNHPDYGTPTYIEYYRNQLTELFTNYGKVTEMWFDGANGGDGYYGGKREARKINGSTYYQWPATLKLVENLQPQVLFFSDAGPHLRWVGNERGVAGETNWNTITPDTLYAGKGGIEQLLNTGSEGGTQWIPAEVDVSIRPGWFYHEKENDKVKTPQQLFEIYLSSVGRGSTLLLNIPPDRRGLLHENDVKSIQGLKKILKNEFGKNLAKDAKVAASGYRGGATEYAPGNVIDGNKHTYWATDDNVLVSNLEITLKKQREVKYILLQEYIPLGQRVKSFAVEVWKDNSWHQVAKATTIGYERILKFEPVVTPKVRIKILDSRAAVVLSTVELY